MAEIVELLKKDKRYNDLDCAADERTKIIMQFLEDQERRGLRGAREVNLAGGEESR